jgi:hypothetical protein
MVGASLWQRKEYSPAECLILFMLADLVYESADLILLIGLRGIRQGFLRFIARSLLIALLEQSHCQM